MINLLLHPFRGQWIGLSVSMYHIHVINSCSGILHTILGAPFVRLTMPPQQLRLRRLLHFHPQQQLRLLLSHLVHLVPGSRLCHQSP